MAEDHFLTMNRRQFFLTGALGAVAAQGQSSEQAERVDFGYAFAPPHRMTVARPEASEKTLLDVEPGLLTISWSYDDLRNMPLATFKTPRTEWHVKVQPQIDGQPFGQSTWKRGGGFLPLLENDYRDRAGSVRLEAIGGVGAALVRVTLHNADSRRHRLRSAVRGARWMGGPQCGMDGYRQGSRHAGGRPKRTSGSRADVRSRRCGVSGRREGHDARLDAGAGRAHRGLAHPTVSNLSGRSGGLPHKRTGRRDLTLREPSGRTFWAAPCHSMFPIRT